MPNHSTAPLPARPALDDSELSRPPVTHWHLPAPRLQGVRFESPVAKIRTVRSPLQPGRAT